MKKLYSIALCTALLLGSCTKSELDSQPTKPNSMRVVATLADEISFAASHTNKFLVESSTPWSAEVAHASESEEWCTLSSYSSDEAGLKAEITILTAANISTEQRSATITIVAEGIDAPETIEVVQMGYGAAIVISEEAVTALGVEGSTATFSVTSTSAWTIAENDYFSFDPASGEGDPYMSEEPVVVTATTKSSNSSSEEITTTALITNADGKEAELTLTQQKAVTLAFVDTTPLSASPEGESFEVGVATDSQAWKLYASHSAVQIDYSHFDTRGVVVVKVAKNATFSSRTILLSLKTDDGAIESDDNVVISQPSKNGSFDLISYMGASKATIDEESGAITIDHLGGLKARFASKDNSIYGMGVYTFEIAEYRGVANSYINLQAENAGPDRINLAVGPTTSTSVVRNASGSIFANPSFKPTLANLESMTQIIFTVMPASDDKSKMNVGVKLMGESGVIFDEQSQMTNYYTANPQFVNNFALYFGICADTAPSATNRMTISAFEFEPYDPTEEPDIEEDAEEAVELDFATLNYTSYLNGTHSIAESGALTITHDKAAQSRFTTQEVEGLNLFGMGTYTIELSGFEGNDSSFINLQAVCSSNAAGEQYNINIGPKAAQSVIKSDKGVWAAVTTLKPTLEQMESMRTLTISLLPVEANPVNMNLTVTIDGEVLSSTGGITSFLNNEAFVNDMNLYFGVGGSTVGSSITIDSISFVPYEKK